MLDLGMVNEFKTKIDLAREMLDVLKERFRVSRVVFDSWYWSEKLVKENVVSELKSNRVQGRVGPGDPRGGGGTPPSEGPTPRTLLRRPDPRRPSYYGKVASPEI
jgi:Archaeal putative transposase ISC1217.